MGKGFLSLQPDDLLGNNMNCNYIIIKITLKMAFLWKTPEAKC
jgi:hypothetical protein